MADFLSKEKRSWLMRRVRSGNTKPEIAVRSMLHNMGFRFRLHSKDLPGKPDIVLKKYHTAIFVNGCFWHRHHGCKKCTTPKSNSQFWVNKFQENEERDKKNCKELKSKGWQVIILWECEISNKDILLRKLSKLIDMKLES